MSSSPNIVPILGQTLGNYRIVNEIGKGGMGVVYAAEHVLLGKRAAVKVLKPDRVENREVIERFFNEARAAAMVKDPGIPEVFDFGMLGDNMAYIVMEMLEGETLGELLDEQSCVTAGRAVAIARHIAGTLGATHAHGIVHRDLKPDNVFLIADQAMPRGERTKILDFGIAKLAPDSIPEAVKTETGRLMGTPYYMSPEQCRGSGNVDHRTDIYSLGCVLFQMLGGRPPFVMQGSGEVLAAHIHIPPPPLASFAPSVPRDLEDLVMSMLAKDPNMRPQSMDEVIDRLNDITSFAGVETPEPSLARSQNLERIVGIERQKTTTLQTGSGELSRPPTEMSASRGSIVWRVAAPILAVAGLVVGVYGAMGGFGGGGENTVAAAPVEATAPVPKAAEPLIVRELVETVPEEVTLVIDSEPSGARVYREADGVRVGETPMYLTLRKGVGDAAFILRSRGHHSQRISVPTNEGGEYVFELKRKRGDDADRDETPEPVVGKTSEPKKAPSEPESKDKGNDSEGDIADSPDKADPHGRDDAIDPFGDAS